MINARTGHFDLRNTSQKSFLKSNNSGAVDVFLACDLQASDAVSPQMWGQPRGHPQGVPLPEGCGWLARLGMWGRAPTRGAPTGGIGGRECGRALVFVCAVEGDLVFVELDAEAGGGWGAGFAGADVEGLLEEVGRVEEGAEDVAGEGFGVDGGGGHGEVNHGGVADAELEVAADGADEAGGGGDCGDLTGLV